MNKTKEHYDALEEYLKSADGKIEVECKGMIPHVSGEMNDAGMLMAALALLKTLETSRGESFRGITEMMNALNIIMNFKVSGECPGVENDGN